MKSILTLAGAAVLLVSCSPTEYEVKREIEINAPAKVVYTQIDDHKNRLAWSPWEAKDPEMTKTYEGPESGVGAIYKWSGNEEVGTGVLTITEATPHTYIKSDLAFTEPWESSSVVVWEFEESGGKTKAVWSIAGELPGFMFWMGQEEMDEAMSEDLETGLENLKNVSEQKAASSMQADIEIPEQELMAEYVDVTGQPYYFIQDKVSWADMNSEFFGTRYGKIMGYLGDDAQNMTGAPFAIIHTWDEEDEMADIAVSIPCVSEKSATDEIKKGLSYQGPALRCEYLGPYEGSGIAHEYIHEFAQANGYELTGSPWESYVTDPGQEPDPAKWVTEVYYPCEKKEDM